MDIVGVESVIYGAEDVLVADRLEGLLGLDPPDDLARRRARHRWRRQVGIIDAANLDRRVIGKFEIRAVFPFAYQLKAPVFVELGRGDHVLGPVDHRFDANELSSALLFTRGAVQTVLIFGNLAGFGFRAVSLNPMRYPRSS